MSHGGVASTSVLRGPRPLYPSPAPMGAALPPLPKLSNRTRSNLLDDLSYRPSPSPPPRKTPSPPALERSTSVPTVESLVVLQWVLPPQADETYLPWIRDVLFLVERLNPPNAQGYSSITDPQLRGLTSAATSALLRIFSGPGPHPADAFYLRGLLHANGAMLELVPKNPGDAFNDFQVAAAKGHANAWFKLGRDYEMVNDMARARECFEAGMGIASENCFYRMGMAKLLGQLGFIPSADDALPLLHRAAELTTTENPHPAYVWALLLLGEFSQVKVEEQALYKFLPPDSSLLDESSKHMENAAYHGFTPAQIRLGHAYEYAIAPYTFDPIKSMQYYSLASQQGEPEADMALSKWFLCGWEGVFEKDEKLAFSFAEKAAQTGHSTAQFAMGYYLEIGIGCSEDLDLARQWYTKAFQAGNAEAGTRLATLSQATSQPLSRKEHVRITNDKLVRRRTKARNDAAASGRLAEIRRENTVRVVNQIQAQAEKSASLTSSNPSLPVLPLLSPLSPLSMMPGMQEPASAPPTQLQHLDVPGSQLQYVLQQQSMNDHASQPGAFIFPTGEAQQPSFSLALSPPRSPPLHRRHATEPVFTAFAESSRPPFALPPGAATPYLPLPRSPPSSPPLPQPRSLSPSPPPPKPRSLPSSPPLPPPRSLSPPLRLPSPPLPPFARRRVQSGSGSELRGPTTVSSGPHGPSGLARPAITTTSSPGIHPEAIRSMKQRASVYVDGPATFEEMGFRVGKAPEKECKIM